MDHKVSSPDEQKFWLRDGQPELSFYRSGVLEGEYKCWYDNGQLYEQSFYRNGKLEGERKAWYENGQIWSSEFYKNGKADGRCISWYGNGQIIIRSFFRDGKHDGKRNYWRADGQIWRQEFFRNGLLNGLSNSWCSDGNPLYRIYVENDRTVDFDLTLKKTIILLGLKRCLHSRLRFSDINRYLISDLSKSVLS